MQPPAADDGPQRLVAPVGHQHHIQFFLPFRQQHRQVLLRQGVAAVPITVKGVLRRAGSAATQQGLAGLDGLGIPADDLVGGFRQLLLDLSRQGVRLLLELLLILRQLELLEFLAGILLSQPQALQSDAGPLHVQLRQGAVVAQQPVSLLHRLALRHIDLCGGLGLGKKHFLELIHGDGTAGLCGVAPIVRHADARHRIHLHGAAAAVAKQSQATPHQSAYAHHDARRQKGAFQFLIHGCHLR